MNRWASLLPLLLWLGLDGWLKQWALNHLTVGQTQPLIPNFLSLTLAFNPGAAWSLFSGQGWLLVAIRLGVGLALVVYLWRAQLPFIRSLPLTLIAAGALSNGLDKLMDGTVVDMLDSHPLSALTQALYGQDYPIFNLADVWVVSGVILLLLPRRATVKAARDSETSGG